jgi:hypothetical protein
MAFVRVMSAVFGIPERDFRLAAWEKQIADFTRDINIHDGLNGELFGSYER